MHFFASFLVQLAIKASCVTQVKTEETPTIHWPAEIRTSKLEGTTVSFNARTQSILLHTTLPFYSLLPTGS